MKSDKLTKNWNSSEIDLVYNQIGILVKLTWIWTQFHHKCDPKLLLKNGLKFTIKSDKKCEKLDSF